MKKLKLILIVFVFALANTTQAQIAINVNIGSRPNWCPEREYASVDFYYLPEVQSYFDTRLSQFVYMSHGRWIHANNLPDHYRRINLNNCQKVALRGYRGNQPYAYYDNHRHTVCEAAPVRNYAYSEHRHDDDHDHYKHYDKKFKKHGHHKR